MLLLARPAGVMQSQVAAWEITPHPGEPIINVRVAAATEGW